MSESSPTPRLTVAVASRNRPELLARCVASLRWLDPLSLEILVIDDASDEPVEGYVRSQIGSDFPWPIRFFRNAVNTGYIACRNRMASLAEAPLVLSLDDDAELIDDSVRSALDLIEGDPGIGAVALAQVDRDGRLMPDYMQPAPVDYACTVRVYRGYGHILRRDVFLELGGYREIFQFYGEETEYCKRLLDRGYSVVYLPEARVRHVHSPAGRNEIVRMRNSVRNACFDAVLNEPFPVPLVSIPVRFYRYMRWRKMHCKYYGLSDRGGLRSIVFDLLRAMPRLVRDRRSLRWTTYRRWRQVGREYPMYRPLESPSPTSG